MASKNQIYLDLKFSTNGATEGNALAVDWFANDFKPDESVSRPAGTIATEQSTVIFHQDFDLLV